MFNHHSLSPSKLGSFAFHPGTFGLLFAGPWSHPGARAVGALPHLRGAAAVHGRHILGLADGMGRRITAARRVKPGC